LSNPPEKSVLVLGVGNILLADEGIGIHVVQRLATMDLPAEVEVIDGGTAGFELIDFFRNKKKVIVIDCLKAEEPPGTIIRATPQELDLRWSPSFSVHQSGLRELLQQASLLTPLPEIIILGIVPQKTDEASMRLSRALESKVDKIVQKVLETVSSF